MLENTIKYFLNDYNRKKGSVLFKRCLYGFVIVKCIYWLCYYDILFGANSIVSSKNFSNLGIGKFLAFNIQTYSSLNASLLFIVPLLLLCILGLTKYRIHFVFDLLIWLIVINIHNKIYPTLSGGDYILNQLLFFNCFICDVFVVKNNFKSQLKIALHNFGVVAVLIQICFVYVFASMAKLGDNGWLNGTAVIDTIQTNHYSTPFILKHIGNLTYFFIFLNYFTLAYQLLFPILVWVKKIKKPFLMLGIIQHLFIAFAMGLVTFGIVMILCYIYFWPEESEKDLNITRG